MTVSRQARATASQAAWERHSGQDENERHQPVGEEADGNDGMDVVEADDPALEAEVDEAGSQQDLEVSREREGCLHQVQIRN